MHWGGHLLLNKKRSNQVKIFSQHDFIWQAAVLVSHLRGSTHFWWITLEHKLCISFTQMFLIFCCRHACTTYWVRFNQSLKQCKTCITPSNSAANTETEWEQHLGYYYITPHNLYHAKSSDSISGKCLRVVILTVILSSEYFGGNVIGGTTESACCISWSQALLQKQKDHQQRDHLRGLKIDTYAVVQLLLSKVHYGIMRASNKQ